MSGGNLTPSIPLSFQERGKARLIEGASAPLRYPVFLDRVTYPEDQNKFGKGAAYLLGTLPSTRPDQAESIGKIDKGSQYD
jgi:hypothetical protein